jgi:hypothetical protein
MSGGRHTEHFRRHVLTVPVVGADSDCRPPVGASPRETRRFPTLVSAQSDGRPPFPRIPPKGVSRDLVRRKPLLTPHGCLPDASGWSIRPPEHPPRRVRKGVSTPQWDLTDSSGWAFRPPGAQYRGVRGPTSTLRVEWPEPPTRSSTAGRRSWRPGAYAAPDEATEPGAKSADCEARDGSIPRLCDGASERGYQTRRRAGSQVNRRARRPRSLRPPRSRATRGAPRCRRTPAPVRAARR